MASKKGSAEKRPNGRPPKFQTPADLQALCDSFFALCEASGKPLTISGLVLHLGTNRETLLDYQKKDGFSDIVKQAKMKVENYVEERLLIEGGAGPIFWLKNHGWRDRQDVAHTGNMQIVVGSDKDKKALESI